MPMSIMIQGTMSGAGKSLLTAALCRIFRQDGLSAAPFKSQNMALNSFVTADGCEIGRAQALQAEAAGLEPSALMNPVLLKPTTDVGSQVIVGGRVRGDMTARDYFRHKRELIPEILHSYETLAGQHDIIVIEGAGSPVELNLKRDDIVNMGLAALVDSPVVLVGNIDPGGIFAQLIGTLTLLEPDELERVKGLIVNRFRGDRSLFADGVSILEEKSGKPVLGVVPFVRCDLEDEDSMSEKLSNSAANGLIDIAVLRLPKLSNFTDFDVFTQYKDVSVRYVGKPSELGSPDLLIIPGTKSTIADMKWLRESGLGEAVRRCHAGGVPVFGICGGYQIMGQCISDPDGLEGGGSIEGLRLLPCSTVFAGEKRQRRVKGQFMKVGGFFGCLSGAEFEGYEIHMGRSDSPGLPLTTCGGDFSGNATGCYVHGIFDSAEVSGRLLRALFAKKGLTFDQQTIGRRDYRNAQLDLLADEVRGSLDMELIYKIARREL